MVCQHQNLPIKKIVEGLAGIEEIFEDSY